MVDNHRQQQQQQLQEAVLRSRIPPEDLQLSDDVIRWGAHGVGRRGVLTFRNSQLKVSFRGKVTAEDTVCSQVAGVNIDQKVE